MKLIIPINRLCPGKETRFPITEYNPVLWLKTFDVNFTVISIDGFIVNNNNKVNGLFKKLEYQEETSNEQINLTDIKKNININELTLVYKLANDLECKFFLFIWPLNYPKDYDVNLKLIYSFKFKIFNNELEIHSFKKANLHDLGQGIGILRGFGFNNAKNLNTASSNVECYLANNTRNPWPGDIDAIIYNNINQRYQAIIEFKTHNINSPIEQEEIGKYGEQDWRRFNVLFDLIDNFNVKFGYRPKLLFIVWGTNAEFQNHASIKIDMIERNRVIHSSLFPRPDYNINSTDLLNYLIELTSDK